MSLPRYQFWFSYTTGRPGRHPLESVMRLADCHNFHDFRRMARRRLPGPIFDYIDGAADDDYEANRVSR